MNAHERFHLAVQMSQDGRYGEALREFEWFHHHALEEEPALRGVRLSYALESWLDLGRIYPEAMDSLLSVRDSKTRQLVQGTRTWDLFHDVVAINETLDQAIATYELFVAIRQQAPEFARECAHVAMPAILNSKDYPLARAYIPQPEASIQWVTARLNEDVDWAQKESDENREMRLDAFVHIYAEEISRILIVFRQTESAELAASLYELALRLVDDESVKARVGELLD
jgi:hypothetical protein